nr:uncharacterized protein LOC109168295 [Ipomoea batatas]
MPVAMKKRWADGEWLATIRRSRDGGRPTARLGPGIQVESDCAQVIKAVEDCSLISSFDLLVNDIKELAKGFSDLCFCFVKGSANGVVHEFARAALSKSDCVDPAANQTAGNQTAVDTATIHKKPNPRCRNLKQSVGTQLTARPSKLIPRKRKMNETPTTKQGDGSEPVVPLGIGIEDTIGVDFWTEAVEVATMFDNVDDAGVDVQQQEEISITPLSQKSDHK